MLLAKDGQAHVADYQQTGTETCHVVANVILLVQANQAHPSVDASDTDDADDQEDDGDGRTRPGEPLRQEDDKAQKIEQQNANVQPAVVKPLGIPSRDGDSLDDHQPQRDRVEDGHNAECQVRAFHAYSLECPLPKGNSGSRSLIYIL